MHLLTTYHPALLALQGLHYQFPGALDFYAFIYTNGVAAYHSKSGKGELFAPIEITTTASKTNIQKFRSEKTEVIWGDRDDLPVKARSQASKRQIKQLSIQDEIEQNYLIFRVPSLNDEAYDTFIIHFAKSFSNFYIPSGRNALSSDIKRSIGRTIRNHVKWVYELHSQQQVNITRIQDAYQQQASLVTEKEEQLTKEREANTALLERYIHQLITEESVNLNCTIQLDSSFLSGIQDAQIPIEQLKQVITTAAHTAYDLTMDKSSIRLTLNLIPGKQQVQSQQQTTRSIQLNKTAQLLDRYEEGAKKLNINHQRINGKTLAKELNISGAAITDAIKKHSNKIKQLLEKHPEKWPLITDFIKPLREIMLEIHHQVG